MSKFKHRYQLHDVLSQLPSSFWQKKGILSRAADQIALALGTTGSLFSLDMLESNMSRTDKVNDLLWENLVSALGCDSYEDFVHLKAGKPVGMKGAPGKGYLWNPNQISSDLNRLLWLLLLVLDGGSLNAPPSDTLAAWLTAELDVAHSSGSTRQKVVDEIHNYLASRGVGYLDSDAAEIYSVASRGDTTLLVSRDSATWKDDVVLAGGSTAAKLLCVAGIASRADSLSRREVQATAGDGRVVRGEVTAPSSGVSSLESLPIVEEKGGIAWWVWVLIVLAVVVATLIVVCCVIAKKFNSSEIDGLVEKWKLPPWLARLVRAVLHWFNRHFDKDPTELGDPDPTTSSLHLFDVDTKDEKKISAIRRAAAKLAPATIRRLVESAYGDAAMWGPTTPVKILAYL
jgi:hypothetical protein